jgi:glycine dehydrogenase subunit 1
MAGRITGRNIILVSDTVSPDRFSAIANYTHPLMKIEMVKHDPQTGLIDINDLKSKITDSVAGFYFECPSYLGVIEENAQEFSDIAHKHGALCIAGVDPISLGVLKPPGQYEADIACGDIQSLGVHMYFGGALAGFIASRDEEKFVMQYPSRLFGITKTAVEGEWGFDDIAYERTSFAVREKGVEFVGTAAALWGITAGVYLSLMGPKGMVELGKHILQKSQYTAKRLSEIDGVQIRFTSSFFKEFVVDFSGTGLSVEKINKALLEKNIFGGKDLTAEFSDLGNCALYCITELITKEDIDTLINSLTEIIKK